MNGCRGYLHLSFYNRPWQCHARKCLFFMVMNISSPPKNMKDDNPFYEMGFIKFWKHRHRAFNWYFSTRWYYYWFRGFSSLSVSSVSTKEFLWIWIAITAYYLTPILCRPMGQELENRFPLKYINNRPVKNDFGTWSIRPKKAATALRGGNARRPLFSLRKPWGNFLVSCGGVKLPGAIRSPQF